MSAYQLSCLPNLPVSNSKATLVVQTEKNTVIKSCRRCNSYKKTNFDWQTLLLQRSKIHSAYTIIKLIFTVEQSKVKYTGIAVRNATLPHHYWHSHQSHAIWDHTLLPATRQRWHSRLYTSQSWYLIQWPGRDARLSWPKHCSKGDQPVPKTAYYSGIRDKHSWPQWDLNLGPLTAQSDILTTWQLH